MCFQVARWQVCCVNWTSYRASTPRSAPSQSTTSARASKDLLQAGGGSDRSSLKMALTSSLPCIDTLAFQLSRHGLDENRNIQPAFYYSSWSEPFDLDFAGKAHSNPKRSRSLPSALVAKRKETAQSQVRSVGLKRAKESDENSEEICEFVKTGAEIHSTSSHTAPGHLTLSVNKYANQANRHKESEAAADVAESSDDEVSGLLVNTLNTSTNLPSVLTEITSSQKLIQNKSRTSNESGPLKRTLDVNEYANDKKRRRPRLDFEKMQLSRNILVPVPRSDQSIFDEVYFRPIIAFNIDE